MAADGEFVAVALAGGELEPDFVAAGYDVANKAYLPIGGRTMLERVLAALRESGAVGKIRCVSPAGAFAHAFGKRGAELCDEVVEPGSDLIDSVLAGVAGLRADAMVIVAATDLPLLTASAIDAFADTVRAAPCDVGYGFVRKESHASRFSQVRHTWVRLREGTFCGGGVSAMRAGAASRVASLLRSFAAARKSPLRLAALFSPWVLARLVLGLVGVEELERRASALAGLRCRGILCDDPVLAVNVDELVDLRAVESIAAARSL
jgi:GTP:adenosylcobinamide-phosphate guanylyltransferase